jgi:hypothetical protein
MITLSAPASIRSPSTVTTPSAISTVWPSMRSVVSRPSRSMWMVRSPFSPRISTTGPRPSAFMKTWLPSLTRIRVCCLSSSMAQAAALRVAIAPPARRMRFMLIPR